MHGAANLEVGSTAVLTAKIELSHLMRYLSVALKRLRDLFISFASPDSSWRKLSPRHLHPHALHHGTAARVLERPRRGATLLILKVVLVVLGLLYLIRLRIVHRVLVRPAPGAALSCILLQARMVRVRTTTPLPALTGTPSSFHFKNY